MESIKIIFILFLISGTIGFLFLSFLQNFDVFQTLQNISSQLNLFQATITPLPPTPEEKTIKELSEEEWIEVGPLSIEEFELPEESLEIKPELTKEERLAQIQENLDDISEKIDILEQNTEEIVLEYQFSLKELFESEIEEFQKAEEIIEKDEELEEIKESKEEQEEEFKEEAEKTKNKQRKIVFCNIDYRGMPERNKIIINEIAWMGTENSSNDEWFEIKNISGQEVNLTGWQILDKTEQIKIIFRDGIIPAGGFYLLERTKDDSVPGISADLIYTGALNDIDEALYLFNENCGLEDEILANPDWPAGDKNQRKSMERNNDFSWHTFSGSGQDGILGTPQKENSSPAVYTGGGSSGGASPPSIPPPAIIKILISEIQISGQTVNDEFIELYNPNDQEVELQKWSLKKKTSSGNESNLVSSAGFSGIIPAFGYFLIVPQPEEDGTPNYQGGASPDLYFSGKTYYIAADNTILLYDQNQNLIDKAGFGGAQDFETQPAENPDENQSIGRKWNEENQEYPDTDNNFEDFEIQTPTPKEKNQSFLFQPILGVSPEILEFSVIEFATPPQDGIFNISNEGNGILEWTSIISYNSPSFEGINWLSINPDFGTAPSEVLVSVDVSELESKDYTAAISVSSLDAENSPREVLVNLTVSSSVIQEPSREMVINEIAWMGTEASSTDEWIELYNNTDEEIDLTGWTLISITDDSPNIILEGFIFPLSYYLIERNNQQITDFEGNFLADFWTSFSYGFKNGGEELELRDNKGNLIDRTDCQKDEQGNCQNWFAGDNSTKQTMERINSNSSGSDSENWANNNQIVKNGKDAGGNSISGTPKSENSVSK